MDPFAQNAAHNVALAHDASALQHLGPRPLPLFLNMLQYHAQTAPEEAQKALTGLKLLQIAQPSHAMPLMPIAASAGRALLYDYGGSGPRVIFVPSLINPANILDLTPDASLLRWLSTQGLHPYLVDWGNVRAKDHGLSISDHITDILLPLIASLGEPVHLVGYCLGGTMALAAAQLMPVQSLTLIAAPWYFSRYPDDAHPTMAKLWQGAKPLAAQMGILPIEALQLMFWQLDTAGTVQKYARFADLPSEAHPLFIAMEQWANGGAPLTYAAARELFEDFIADDLPGKGNWKIGEAIISPEQIKCPLLDVVSLNDQIVPHVAATGHPNRLEINRGHVGMITGSQAKAQLWEPLREWLSQPHKNC